MAKRSRKPNKQKLDKISKAQHRNNFIKRLYAFCDLVGGRNTYKLFPASELELLYLTSSNAPLIRAAKNEKIEKTVLEYAHRAIPHTLRINTIKITNQQISISFYDYFTMAINVMMMLTLAREDNNPKYADICDRMQHLIDDEDSFDAANEFLQNVTQTFGTAESALNRQMYWINRSDVASKANRYSQQILLEIHTEFPQIRHLSIDDINRPVTIVGWCFPYYGFYKAKLKPSQIGLHSADSDEALDVVIQNHAFIRLRERLDNLETGFVHWSMFNSIMHPTYVAGRNGCVLMEFNFLQSKLGYLVVELVEDMILIRTFLFLTQSGTPEGDKIEEICGLGRLDKKYLGIDKFSTFMSLDFTHDPEVTQIFENAGCHELIYIHDKFQLVSTTEMKRKPSDMLSKYLGGRKEDIEAEFRELG